MQDEMSIFSKRIYLITGINFSRYKIKLPFHCEHGWSIDEEDIQPEGNMYSFGLISKMVNIRREMSVVNRLGAILLKSKAD